MVKTIEELQDSGIICDYCSVDDKFKGGGVYGTPNGYISCEGTWCKEAYEIYLEEAEDED